MPPARGNLTINTFQQPDGVFGQIYSETGATVWVWSRKLPGVSQLDAARFLLNLSRDERKPNIKGPCPAVGLGVFG